MQEQTFIDSTTYEINTALSYSRLIDFAKNGPEALINRNSGSSLAMSLGQLTDDFLNENINILDKYYIYDGEKPTASLGKLCNAIIDYYREVPSREEVIDIVQKLKLWSNIKDEKILLSKFDIPEFWNYISTIIQKGDKEIITSVMYAQAEEMATLIKQGEATAEYFTDTYQRIYQYAFDVNINNVYIRGLIDMIAIDHKNKTIDIIDFKTGSDPAINFSNIFIMYRYFIQAAIYSKAFKHICKALKLKGYRLNPFKFIYISKSEKIPVIYSVTKKWHQAALKGFTTTTGYTYRGLYNLIDDAVWHFNNRRFDAPRYLIESGCKLELNDDLITIMDE